MRRPLSFSLAAIAASAVIAAPVAATAQTACTPGEHTLSNETVTSPDGTVIAITVMRPGIADCRDVAVVMHGHGWSGSRAKALDSGLAYGLNATEVLDAGYAVVSVDARGHGDSGDVAQAMQPDKEITDYPAIMTYLSTLDWVLADTDSGLANDIVVGGLGGSYGGGWQTMTSIFDDRMDALVPQITWHNLAHSLSPNGVPRTAWLTLLNAGGNASARPDPRLNEWYTEGVATGSTPAAAEEQFLRGSPFSYTDRLDTPAMYISGLPDTLFTVNEALDNYLTTVANDADSWLIGIQNGHILPGVQPTGVGAPARSAIDHCATDLGHLILDFYDTYLLQDAAAEARLARFPEIALGTEQGRCAVADAWPVEESRTDVELPGFVVPQGSASLMLPLLNAAEETTIAGVPTFSANVPLPSSGNRMFLSLAAGSPDNFRLIDDQVTPYEVPVGESGDIAFDLAAVSTTLAAGEQLFLRIEGQNLDQFAGMQSRSGSALAMQGITVSLPVTTQVVDAFDTTRPEGTVATPPAPAAPVAPAAAPASAENLPATGGGLAAFGLLMLGGAGVLLRRRVG